MIDISLVGAALAVITYLHYATPPEQLEYHALYRAAYYLPVIYAGLRFGLAGGVLAPIVASLLYAPWVILFIGRPAAGVLPSVADILILNGAGWIAGMLQEADAGRRREALLYAEEQREAREELERRAVRIEEMNRELERRLNEKKELEEQLRRADKLAALGELVAGVAHEIKNPIGVVKTTVQVMEREFSGDAHVAEFTRVIRDECDRMNRRLSQFLGFARPAEPAFQSVDAREVVEATLGMLGKYLPERHVEVETEYGEDLPPVRADGSQLHQVLLNLIINAVEAMPNGGELSVGVRRNPDDAGYVTFAVADTGPGIPEPDLARIFDPFYTTKPTGTGLGLAVAHRIVDAHGGFIEVESGRQGTTFRVSLPVAP
ncbi:MAG: two-component system sensor histidine kinase NtrB [Bacillota bacterium]